MKNKGGTMKDKDPNTVTEENKNVPESEAAGSEKAEKAEKSEKKESRKDRKNDKKELEAVKAKLEALEKDFAAEKDAHLRVLAEYDNFRKRSQREKEAAYGDSKASVLAMLLPVIDNFDRAAENKTDDIDVYRKGIEMTLSQFTEILTKLGVESFGEAGEPFNPELHNAVMHIENEDLPESTVSAVFEKGYRMGDRILRCATVQVAN